MAYQFDILFFFLLTSLFLFTVFAWIYCFRTHEVRRRVKWEQRYVFEQLFVSFCISCWYFQLTVHFDLFRVHDWFLDHTIYTKFCKYFIYYLPKRIHKTAFCILDQNCLFAVSICISYQTLASLMQFKLIIKVHRYVVLCIISVRCLDSSLHFLILIWHTIVKVIAIFKFSYALIVYLLHLVRCVYSTVSSISKRLTVIF